MSATLMPRKSWTSCGREGNVFGAQPLFALYATGANEFEAVSMSEELAQSVALGDMPHLCVFHIAQ